MKIRGSLIVAGMATLMAAEVVTAQQAAPFPAGPESSRQGRDGSIATLPSQETFRVNGVNRQATAGAQQPATANAQEMAKLGTIPNPVSAALKAMQARNEKNMVAAAESMPAEKYGFKPSPEMNSFGHLVLHIAQSNNSFCSKISGVSAPDVKYSDSDPKDKLVAALKASFEYCTTALGNVDDSKLGDQMMLFGNRPASRAAAMMSLAGSWTDHYATEAIYLRLNGILPPTAQPAKQ